MLCFSCLLLSIFHLCLSLHILYFLFLLLSLSLSIFYFLSCYFLSSSLTFFVYHLIFISASISFFVFYPPSWLSFNFISCLSSIMLPLLFSLSFCAFVFFYYYKFYPPVLLFCIFHLSIFCMPFRLIFLYFYIFFYFSLLLFYFVLFSTLFNYLVLILDFNYCKFSLLFIFSMDLCYFFLFSLAVFFTKLELFSFFTLQPMLCSVF